MERESDKKKDEKDFVDGLAKEQEATKAYQKLHRKPLEISVNRQLAVVETLERNIVVLEQSLEGLDEPKKAEIQKQITELNAELIKLDADKIEGILTPLTYRDVNDIKAAITEAVVHFKEYKFEMNVVMARIAAEERYMTVFCALKRKDDPTRRYFDTLEDVAEIDETAIYVLYSRWEQHFVLTDSELKN